MDILKKRFFNIKGLAIYIAIFAIVLTLGTSYAYFIYNKDGNSHELIAGNVYMNSTDKGSVSLTGLYPMSDEDGIENGIKYTFDVTGYNLSNKDIHYGVYVNYGDEKSGKTRFRDADIKFYLTETINEVTSRKYGPASVKDFNRSILYANTIEGNISKDTPINISYELTMWISDNVLISDSVTELEGRSIYTTDEFKNSYASIKVEVYGDFVEKNLPVIGYITYDLSKIGLDNLSKTPIYSGKYGTITTEVLSNTPYELLGWSTSYNGDVEYNSGDTIKPEDVVNNNLTLYPVVKADLVDAIESTLASNIKKADKYGTRYLQGTNDSISNYVWYSGKLWRIVSINSDNTIKLVTQGNMSSIAWSIESETVDGTTTYNTVYKNSQLHNWLKNEFLPTLTNNDTLLADTTWDYTTYASSTATRVEAVNFVENEKIGLLTIYDYYNVYNYNSSNYLNNNFNWWTMSPQTEEKKIWLIFNGGAGNNAIPKNNNAVRPSINLKSDIKIMRGNGTKGNPYMIVGDKDVGVPSELLNNRISGEYIKFNNVLYRLVGIEEINGKKLTKVTMADYSLNNNTLTNSLAFGENAAQRIFSPTYGIGLYLEEWYQADETSETYATTYINDTYKKMIATSIDDKIIWYTGPTAGTGYDYTLSKTGNSVSATMGLGYYGEIFSSQFGDGVSTSISTWLMTIRSESDVWINGSASVAFSNVPYSTSSGVRPSMYLKSDVKIVSGSGMPHDPYEITQ